MSHAATNWAIANGRGKGLKPAAKLVLWHLCDRYHPDYGCFPNQQTLANDCEMARSTLNEQLQRLEDAELIRREQRIDPATKQQKSTRYRLAFEPNFQASIPCPETGHGEAKAVSGKPPKPCPENAGSRVQNPDTIDVIDPVIDPVSAPAARFDISETKTALRAQEHIGAADIALISSLDAVAEEHAITVLALNAYWLGRMTPQLQLDIREHIGQTDSRPVNFAVGSLSEPATLPNNDKIRTVA